MKLNRILRNAEDSSPGGGRSPAPEPEPAASPEPTGDSGTAAEPLEAVVAKAVASALAAEIPKLRNGVFADLRRDGALKKEKTVPQPTAPTPQGAPAPVGGVALADVEAMMERERVITTRQAKLDLSDAVVRRMRSALQGVDAGQYAAEADSFLSDLGIGKRTTNAEPATAPVVPASPAQPPISDKGSPAPGGVLDWEREFAENPIGMSAAARQRMDAKYGADKARRMRLEAAQRQAENIKVTKPQG